MFFVNPEGRIVDINLPANAEPAYNQSCFELVATMSGWKSAERNAEKVRSSICLTFLFMTEMIKASTFDLNSDVPMPLPDIPPVEVYEPPLDKGLEQVARPIIDFPDVEASFPGGAVELMHFLNANMEYPKKALENKDQGKVYMKFMVDQNGSISNVKVERGVSIELDREAKRLIRLMPKWIPGEAAGKKVATNTRILIVFALD